MTSRGHSATPLPLAVSSVNVTISESFSSWLRAMHSDCETGSAFASAFTAGGAEGDVPCAALYARGCRGWALFAADAGGDAQCDARCYARCAAALLGKLWAVRGGLYTKLFVSYGRLLLSSHYSRFDYKLFPPVFNNGWLCCDDFSIFFNFHSNYYHFPVEAANDLETTSSSTQQHSSTAEPSS